MKCFNVFFSIVNINIDVFLRFGICLGRIVKCFANLPTSFNGWHSNFGI